MSAIDLNGIEWKPTRHRGVFVYPLWHDEQSGDMAMLIRLQPGCAYPRHRHVDDEDVFILQGVLRDEMIELSVGRYHRYSQGSIHSPIALAIGEDCIFLCLARGGVELIS
ncbi:MAG: cupin domain-containing protein [Acidobacteriota bacterium]